MHNESTDHRNCAICGSHEHSTAHHRNCDFCGSGSHPSSEHHLHAEEEEELAFRLAPTAAQHTTSPASTTVRPQNTLAEWEPESSLFHPRTILDFIFILVFFVVMEAEMTGEPFLLGMTCLLLLVVICWIKKQP